MILTKAFYNCRLQTLVIPGLTRNLLNENRLMCQIPNIIGKIIMRRLRVKPAVTSNYTPQPLIFAPMGLDPESSALAPRSKPQHILIGTIPLYIVAPTTSHLYIIPVKGLKWGHHKQPPPHIRRNRICNSLYLRINA